MRRSDLYCHIIDKLQNSGASVNIYGNYIFIHPSFFSLWAVFFYAFYIIPGFWMYPIYNYITN